jgi:primary-amine oxidase
LLQDKKFLAALEKFKLPEGAVLAVDPWLYGSDTTDPIPRLFTFIVYFRNPKNNHPVHFSKILTRKATFADPVH